MERCKNNTENALEYIPGYGTEKEGGRLKISPCSDMEHAVCDDVLECGPGVPGQAKEL